MRELLGLLANGGDYRWVAMPNIHYPDTAREIEVLRAVHIGDRRARATRRKDGMVRIQAARQVALAIRR
jgi:hypothetical protein